MTDKTVIRLSDSVRNHIEHPNLLLNKIRYFRNKHDLGFIPAEYFYRRQILEYQWFN